MSTSIASVSTIPGRVIRYQSHGMDGVYSILAGLVLRVIVDAATLHNVKLSGILIGLWEGVVLLHYVNKAPTSSDPYLAYGVRLFVDFLVTESIFKLMIVLLWSTMGMVLADVAPAVWVDYGLKRQWSRLRRELYWASRALFARKRVSTVRFVSAPTIASASSTVSSVAGSTVVTTAAPVSIIVPESPTVSEAPTSVRAPTMRRRSSVPGTFPGAAWSETGTDVGTTVTGADQAPASVLTSQSSHITIARIVPTAERSEDSYTYTTRSSSPTYSLEYSDDPSASNPVDIPSEEDEILVHGHSHHPQLIQAERQTTPKQMVVVLPPTPSDSLQDWDSSQDSGDEVPPSPWIPVIPDSEPLEEWETVRVEEAEAPTPPPKDVPPESREDGSDSTRSSMTVLPPPIPVNEPSDPEPELGPEPEPESAPAPEAPIPEPDTAEYEPEFTPAAEAPIPEPDTAEPESAPAPEAPIPEPDTAEPESALAPEAPIPEPDTAEPELDQNVEPTQIDESVPLPDPTPAPEAEAGPPKDTPSAAEAARTPPPAFEDLYGSDGFPVPGSAAAAPTADSKPPTERAGTPPPAPSPIPFVKRALSLRKEAIELTARISSLKRQRETSLSEHTSATIAKMDIDRAEKELAELNEKAEGAFVGAHNPPTASLYEFNTAGLKPEEAVRQIEARLGRLLLSPVPPAGTTPEDLAHDSPNRGALKVIMQKSVKGRQVKKQLLAALTDNGLNWSEDFSRPNVIDILLPVMAESEVPEPSSDPPDGDQSSAEKKEDVAEY